MAIITTIIKIFDWTGALFIWSTSFISASFFANLIN